MIVWEGADPLPSGRFYVAVINYVMLFISDMWLVTPCILMAVENLHNRSAQQISGRITQWLQNSYWNTPIFGEL